MVKLIKGIIYIGLIFFGTLTIASFSKLILFNEIGDFFSFNEVLIKDYNVRNGAEDFIVVSYSFEHEGNWIETSKSIKSKIFYKYQPYEEGLLIVYNNFFPKMNYFKGVNRVAINYFYVVFFFLLFLFLCAMLRYGNIEKWLERYKNALVP